MQHRKISAGLGGIALIGGVVVAGTAIGGADASAPAVAGSTPAASAVMAKAHRSHSTVSGSFVALNNSGVQGKASISLNGQKARVTIYAKGLMKNAPHAAHIHFSAGTSHTCPTLAQDTNGDQRLTVSEGATTYGAIQKSLTVKGDSSPDSALAVDRFPTTPQGVEKYSRTVGVSKSLARSIRDGKVHIVLHGLDYNNNGVYDLGTVGASDIAPTLPAEATDPAACAELN